MKLRESIISGIIGVVSAIAAALVPILMPVTLNSKDSLVLVRELKMDVSPSLLVSSLADREVSALSKKMTVLIFQNVSDSDIDKFKLEIRMDKDWVNVQSGSSVSGNLVTEDQQLAPMGERSFQSVIRRLPPNASQNVFLLSDSDFSVQAVVPNRSNIKMIWADRSMLDQASLLKRQNYLIGAFGLLSVLAFFWTLLRIFRVRTTLQFRRTP